MADTVADTSIFVAVEEGRPLARDVGSVRTGVSVITIGELRAGVLVATDTTVRELRLRTLTAAMGLEPIPIDGRVANEWARLRLMLRDAQKSMGVNDSWIAATAMALKVPVLTQDRGYVDLPGLDVIRL